MPKQQSKKGKGKYARYKDGGRKDSNKLSKAKKRERKLEKRKQWRIKKFKNKPVNELSGTTRHLFSKWKVLG